MEKKGDLLNQLAIIVDLLEKMNLNSKSTTIIIDLSEDEYLKTFDYFNKKNKGGYTSNSKTFNIKIGLSDIVFNKSSVETVRSS